MITKEGLFLILASPGIYSSTPQLRELRLSAKRRNKMTSSNRVLSRSIKSTQIKKKVHKYGNQSPAVVGLSTGVSELVSLKSALLRG